MLAKFLNKINRQMMHYFLDKGCLKIRFQPLSIGGYCGSGSLFGCDFDCCLDVDPTLRSDDPEGRAGVKFVFLDTHG